MPGETPKIRAAIFRLVEYYGKVREYKSGIVLVLANLVPLIAVLFLGWSGFQIVFLYWLENVIIGFFNVLKMLVVGAIGDPGPLSEGGGPAGSKEVSHVVGMAGMIFLAGFFTIHYGMFTFIHGIFVVVMFRIMPAVTQGENLPGDPLALLVDPQIFTAGLWLAFLALFLSHAFSFGFNFLYRGEYKKVNGAMLMIAPYGRIVVMHLAIIFGAFLGILIGFPVGILLLLIFMKIGVDLALHLKERQKGAIRLGFRS